MKLQETLMLPKTICVTTVNLLRFHVSSETVWNPYREMRFISGNFFCHVDAIPFTTRLLFPPKSVKNS